MTAGVTRTVESRLCDWQGEFHRYDSKVGIVIGGLASGKSRTCAEWLIDRALEAPRSQSAIITKTVKQAREGALVTFKERLSAYGFRERRDWIQNKTTLAITMIRGQLRGHVFAVWSTAGGAYESIKGTEYDSIWADEVQTWEHGETAFAFLMGRNRPSPQAMAAYGYDAASGDRFCRLRSQIRCSANPPDSTANWMHRAFISPRATERMRDDAGNEIRVWRISTFDNYLLPDRVAYINGLRSTMSPERFKIEVLGESGNVGAGVVYTSFHELRNVARAERTEGLPFLDVAGLPIYTPARPLDWAHDFGVDPRAALLIQTHDLTYAPVFGYQRKVIYILDEIEIRDGSTDAMIREFVENRHDDPMRWREIRLFGDASGANRNSTTGDSDWAMLENDPRLAPYAMAPYRHRKNPPIVDRVNAMNLKLCDANGDVGVVIHPRCIKTIEDFTSTRWLPGTRLLDHGSRSKEIFRTHLSDCAGYYVEYEFPLTGGIAYATSV